MPDTTRPAHPLTAAQSEIWLAQEQDFANPRYTIGGYLEITGPIDLRLLGTAIRQMTAECEAFHLRFVVADGTVRQFTDVGDDWPLPVVDVSAESDPRAAAEARMRADLGQAIDVRRERMFSMCLYRVGDLTTFWYYRVHHIALDGFSTALTITRTAQLYNELRGTGRSGPDSEPFGAFTRVLDADASYRESADLAADRRFWSDYLAGYPAATGFPGAASPGSTPGIMRESIHLSSGQIERLKAVVERDQTRLTRLLIAMIAAFVHRQTGARDFVLGLPVVARTDPRTLWSPGMMSNAIALRLKVSPRMRVRELTAHIAAEMKKVMPRQRYRIEDIHRDLNLAAGDTFLGPNVNIMLYDNDASFGGCPAELHNLSDGIVAFSIAVGGSPDGSDLKFHFEGGYTAEALADYRARFAAFFESFVSAGPDQPVGRLSLLTADEERLLLASQEARMAAVPEATLPELFEARAAANPDAIAVVDGERELRYAELDDMADRLARRLAGYGAGPERVVAIVLDRSAELLVAILGVLKSGAACLPVDVGCPPGRMAFMFEDAAAVLVVTSASLAARLPATGTPALLIDGTDDPAGLDLGTSRVPGRASRPCPHNAAYLIYTADRGGRPKAVVINHRGIVRSLGATGERMGFGPADVWSLSHPCTSGRSVWEVWGALRSGGRLVVVPPQITRSPARFLRLLADTRVTVLCQTPAGFYQLMAADSQDSETRRTLSLRWAILGGEAIDFGRISDWYLRHPDNAPTLVSMYGVTEATAGARFRAMSRADTIGPAARRGLIGQAIGDLPVYVLDSFLWPAPPGTAGEVYIAGAGLARGYLGRPELTAERFVADPFGPPGSRMYRTGDVARRTADGDLEYLGRADDQVKIRGFRVEPAEIEAALSQHPEVAQAAVVPAEDRRLVGYVVPAAGPETADPETETDGAGRQVSEWQELYDSLYGESPAAARRAPLGENFTGWASSYDDEPIPLPQMREWRDATVGRVLALRPRRVLELGVGTGLLLAGIAPSCDAYWGIDLSATVIETLTGQVAADPVLAGRVELRGGPAHELGGLPDAFFDTVVINSTVQYFPSADYLTRVLRAALTLLVPGGCVFVGDVLNARLARCFHTAVQLSRLDGEADSGLARRAIEQSLLTEEELLVDPDFFVAFGRSIADIGAVDIRLKRAEHHNELSRYRYDVVLRKQPAVAADVATVPVLRWDQDVTGIGQLEQQLRAGRPGTVRVAAVPNLRVAGEAAATHALESGASAVEAAGWLRRPPRHPAVDPQALATLGEKLGYRVLTTWSADPAAFDALFLVGGSPADDSPADAEIDVFDGLYLPVAADRATLASFVRHPNSSRRTAAIVGSLREYLRERLPEHMIPAAVMVVDQIPLTVNGTVNRRALPPVQYADYASWQQDLPDGQLGYWRQALAGLPERIELPADRPHPARRSGREQLLAYEWPAELHAMLTVLAESCGASLSMVLQAGLAALLTRLGAGTDIPVGCPVAGPVAGPADELPGSSVNTLVIRTDTSGDPAFADLVARVRQRCLDAYANQDIPFEHLVDVLNPSRSGGHHPLFQVMLSVTDDPGTSPLALRGLDLVLSVAGRGGRASAAGLSVLAEFSTDVFDPDTVSALVDRLARLLRTAAADPATRLSGIDLLSAAERHQVLEQWNDTAAAVPPATIPELFAAQAARTPDAAAVSGAAGTVTYAGLARRAAGLARRLQALGVGPETAVGLLMERSVDAVAAMLAVLQAGGTVLPLDARYPDSRITAILAAAGAPVLITHQPLADRAATHATHVLMADDPCVDPADDRGADRADDRGPCPVIHPGQLAFLLFTSGSTGRPKGVAITHANVTALARDAAFASVATGRMLAHASYVFDASLGELWTPLLAGGQVVIPPPGEPDIAQLAKVIREERITSLLLTPALLALLAETSPGCFAGVAEVWTGGEIVPPEAVRAILSACPGTTVVDAYGPTEGTEFVTTYRVSAWGQVDGPLPIGTPRGNTACYVLDPWLQPVPPGVTGELYLAGAGLARGYHGDPAQTASRFIADPFGPPGGRLYRTGDLARWRPDGTLAFAGRADQQVKIRGFRIELGEIETVLAQQPDIARAIATVWQPRPGDQRIAAYLLPATGTEPDPAAARAHAAAVLPDYMVPATCTVISHIPLTVNGKIDHTALPEPEPESAPAGQGCRWRSPLEEVLAGLFADVLGVPAVRAEDNFFDLGGHSLLATRLVSRIRAVLDAELSVRALFDAPSVAGLTQLLDEAGPPRPRLRRQARPERMPLSAGQRRLWFLYRLEGPSPAYNVPVAVRLEGEIDLGTLRAALTDVATRHESLRTVFPQADGVPCQQVNDLPVPLEVVAVRPGHWRAAAEAAARYGFELDRESPFRAVLVSAGPAEHVLVLVMHHIAVDGWSFRPLFSDLATAYAARRSGMVPSWRPLPVQYADYTLWQRGLLGSADDPGSVMARQVNYWRQALAGLPERIELPADRPHPARRSGRGQLLEFEWPAELHAMVAGLAAACGASLYMVLQAGLAALLTRLGAGTDIPVGAPIAGRTDETLDDLVGFFVNTLVIRTDTSGDPAFADLVARVRQRCLDAYANQDVPFEHLVDVLNPSRSGGHHPLFQVMLSVTDDPREDLPQLPGLSASLVPVSAGTARMDLVLSVAGRGGRASAAGLSVLAEFSTDVFDPDTVSALVDRLARLLRTAAADPATRLSGIDLLSAAERHQVLEQWNDTAAAVPPATIPELFAAQAARTPDAAAVSGAAGTVTYAGLARRAAGLARRLQALGAGPETAVGLLMERSVDAVAAMLAVLRVGGTVLPLDARYPDSRIAAILAAAGTRVLITHQPLADRAATHATHILMADDPGDSDGWAGRAALVRPGQLAFLLFTSGSTGRPKGVAITHANVTALARDAAFASVATGRMLAHSSYVFDASLQEIWVPLLAGGQVVIPAAGEPDIARLAAVIAGEHVTSVFLTPALLALLAETSPGCFAGVAEVWTGGEIVPPEAVRAILSACPDTTVVNGYGPTEGTAFVTSHQIAARGQVDGPLPIGTPRGNTACYVLDPWLQPVPPGVTGELYLAGAGLARGYHGDPAQTASRFIADPFGPPGGRLYRTGDLARWRPDGTLAFAGRADQQVKIRGFRIELGEIETVLAQQPDIARAIATVWQPRPGDQRIAAYLLPATGTEPDPAAARAHAAAVLPDYMVPATCTVISHIPLTVNGKIDHTALPEPQLQSLADSGGLAATDLERTIAAAWADVLAIGPSGEVGAEQNFFDLGGNSLLLARLHARLETVLGMKIPIQLLFEYSTVRSLARWTAGSSADDGRARAGAGAKASTTGGEDDPIAARARRSRAARGTSAPPARDAVLAGVRGNSHEKRDKDD